MSLRLRNNENKIKMIAYFQNKIANYIVDKRLKHKKGLNQSFSNLIEKSFTFLVVMPEEEKDFRNCQYVLKFLDENGKHITIFSLDFRRNLIHQKYRPATIEYGLTDYSKLKLPSKRLVDELSVKEFNAVIDLNRGENLFCSYASNLVNSSLRIGFRKNNSDRYYNIQIADTADNPEISYKNFINCLQMF